MVRRPVDAAHLEYGLLAAVLSPRGESQPRRAGQIISRPLVPPVLIDGKPIDPGPSIALRLIPRVGQTQARIAFSRCVRPACVETDIPMIAHPSARHEVVSTGIPVLVDIEHPVILIHLLAQELVGVTDGHADLSQRACRRVGFDG